MLEFRLPDIFRSELRVRHYTRGKKIIISLSDNHPLKSGLPETNSFIEQQDIEKNIVASPHNKGWQSILYVNKVETGLEEIKKDKRVKNIPFIVL